MKLRYLLLFTTAIGACGALLLGADMYRRMQDAEGLMMLNNLPMRQDSVLVFGMPHTIGLISLALLFMAMFLLMIMALRDPAFRAALEGQKPPVKETPPAPAQPSSPPIESIPISVAAAKCADTLPLQPETVSTAPEAVAEAREIQNALAAAPMVVEASKPSPVLAFEVPVAPASPTSQSDQQHSATPTEPPPISQNPPASH